MTSAGCTEYTHHTEALIYIKPRILKGFEFHKKFKFIPQVVENWKISEMRKGAIMNQPVIQEENPRGRKESEIEQQEIKSKKSTAGQKEQKQLKNR